MSPYERVSIIKKEVAPRPGKGRPAAVNVIAFYQLLKAGYFLFLFREIWGTHVAEAAMGNASADPLMRAPYMLSIPLIAILFVVVGVGIWWLKEWARFTPGFVFSLMIVYGWFAPASDLAIPLGYMNADLVLAAGILELTSLGVLYLLPSVVEAFGERHKR